MTKEIVKILAEITRIQSSYAKPLLLKDSKDELIDEYEKLAFKMLSIINDLQEENNNINSELAWYKQTAYNLVINEKRFHEIRDYVNSTDFVYDEQYKKKDKIETIINGGNTNEKI